MANGPRLPVDLRNLLAHGPVVVSRRLGRLPLREHVGAHLLFGSQKPILLVLQSPQVLVGTSRCEFHATTSSARRAFDGIHHSRRQQSHSTVSLVRFGIDTFGVCGNASRISNDTRLRKRKQVNILPVGSQLMWAIMQLAHRLQALLERKNVGGFRVLQFLHEATRLTLVETADPPTHLFKSLINGSPFAQRRLFDESAEPSKCR